MKRDFLLALLLSVLAKFLADEAKEWVAWLPNILIRWAARRFRSGQKDRIEEEWLAHANDLPGNLAKLSHALGCVATAVRVTNAVAEALAIVLLLIFAPIFTVLFLSEFFGILMNGPMWFYRSLPEVMRARRLQSGAAGQVVLGLDKLDFVDADLAFLLDRSQPPPDAMDFLFKTKVLRRILELGMSALHRFAGPPDEFFPPLECLPRSAREAWSQRLEERRHGLVG